jgi:apolipoprotein N-acyltransferase
VPPRDAWIGAGLTVASGTSFGLAFPPTSWLPIGWLALAPLFVALRGGGVGRALLLTWLWCLAASWAVGAWFPRSAASYFHQPMPVALALYFGVFTTMAGPYYAAFALAWRVLERHFSVALPLLAGAAWVMAEFGRGRLFTGTAFFIGNPWGLLGYSHADWLPFVQIASVTGIYGASFALACANAALAGLALAWREPARRRAAALGFGVGLLPALAVLTYGSATLRGAAPEPGSRPLEVAVIQGNVSIGSRWRADAYGENLDLYLRLTAESLAAGHPRIAFWPEAALTFFLESEPDHRQAIASLLAPADLELVVGGPRATGLGSDAHANSVFVLRPDGTVAGHYDKQFLVPFAEYFPLGIDVLRRRFGRVRSFRSGSRVEPLATRAGLAGVLVCNEAMLPEAARLRVAAGAAFLVNPSNDTWISDVQYTEQQLDIARVRAVEQRRWLVRASTSGPSALVDPWGRVVARSDTLRPAVVAGEIVPRSGQTPYARLGDAFAFTCCATVAVALAGAWQRARRIGA